MSIKSIWLFYLQPSGLKCQQNSFLHTPRAHLQKKKTIKCTYQVLSEHPGHWSSLWFVALACDSSGPQIWPAGQSLTPLPFLSPDYRWPFSFWLTPLYKCNTCFAGSRSYICASTVFIKRQMMLKAELLKAKRGKDKLHFKDGVQPFFSWWLCKRCNLFLCRSEGRPTPTARLWQPSHTM